MSLRLADVGQYEFALGPLVLALLQVIADTFLAPILPVAAERVCSAASRANGVLPACR